MSIGYCIALFLSKTLTRCCGRLNSVLAMHLLLALELLLFGLAKESSSDALFIRLSIFARLGEGMATSYILSTLITMATVYYADNASYINAVILGIHLAEFLGWGGLLFSALGYTGIFVAQSATILMFGLLLCYFRGHEESHPLQQIQEEDTIGYLTIFLIPVSGWPQS